MLLVGFGLTRSVATLGVLAWRLVNFWLPIPTGAIAYISLKVPRGAGLPAMRRALADFIRPGHSAREKPGRRGRRTRHRAARQQNGEPGSGQPGTGVAQCAHLGQPLYGSLKQVLFQSKVIGTDDTSVKVLDIKLPFARTGRIWPYCGDKAHPVIVYDYTATRGRAGTNISKTIAPITSGRLRRI